MATLEDLILKNLINYPEWTEYNDVILSFITSHEKTRPDMCIEGCKSLIEGISKFVYFSLSEERNEKEWSKLNFKTKFGKCSLSLKLDGYEEEFLAANNEIVFKLGQIRNERGDVSHGQAYPKNSYSSEGFARFISSWTDGICYFVLSRYIELKQRQLESESTSIYSSQQFEEFDRYLDETHHMTDISYSRALKEQDPLKYEASIDDYFRNK